MPRDDPPTWKFVLGVVVFFGVPVSVGLVVGLLWQLIGLPEDVAGMMGTAVACFGLIWFLQWRGDRQRRKKARNRSAGA